jgi:serine/threonine protein kinase
MIPGKVPACSAPGVVLAGKYVLHDVIGEGGMGTVFEAAHSALARTVAIKVMHPHLAVEPQHVRRFRQEAIAGGRFSHVHSVGILDFDRTPSGHPFLVMELIRGPTLVRFAYENGPLPLEQVVTIGEQLLGALETAHAAGVVHGDVKSDNIVVQAGEVGPWIKLLDYGLAIVDGVPGVSQPFEIPGPPQIVGTPDYMAPELISGGCPTFASDLYAVGVLLYELLTEARPFVGQPYQELLRQHLAVAATPPSECRPDRGISAALDEVVLCALAKSPGDRFSGAGTFAHALRRALTMVAPPPPTEPRTITVPLVISRAASQESTAQTTHALHQQIAAALRRGVVEDIVAAYLALAEGLKSRSCFSTAAMELAEAIDVVTSGSTESPECIEQLRTELKVVRELAARTIKPKHLSAAER